jgi:hypothetical protein
VAWVSPRRIASLQHLARLKLRRCLTGPDQLEDANFAERVPRLIRNLVVSLFSSTVHVNRIRQIFHSFFCLIVVVVVVVVLNLFIVFRCEKCHVPEEHRIRDYVCRPPPGNTRLYCTMIRRDEEDSPSVAGCHGGAGGVDGLIDPIDPAAAAAATGGGGVGFTLYLEFLGGLIPLLKVLFFDFSTFSSTLFLFLVFWLLFVVAISFSHYLRPVLIQFFFFSH